MIRKTIISLAAAFCFCVLASAQIVGVELPQAAQQYGRVDIDVKLVGQWNNPFRAREANLEMIVVSPSGATSIVPGFYRNGASGEQSLWQIRFTPVENGIYTILVRYSQPGLESLSKKYSLDVMSGEGHGFLHVNDNWTLRYDDGTLFRGVGENICWESRDEDDSRFFSDLHEQAERFNYAAMLPKFAQNGGNFTRIWMCSWNFPIDRKDNFNNSRYSATTEPVNESAAAHLDETVELCEKLGIKVMLCMGQGDVRADREFFVGDAQKERYRNRLRYIVARWGYSPAIAMWEFFNEIDNIQFADSSNPIPAADIVGWHTEMSRYLKSIDAFDHIVTTSISHRDLEGLNDVPDIDINQKHIYRGTDQIPGTIARYEKQHGKPYIVGEFGYEWDWSKNFDTMEEGFNSDFRRGLWQGLFNPTPVTPMSWWWEWFDEHKMVGYFRAPALINADMLASGEGSFVPVSVEAGCEAYAVRCGSKTYVYVYNGGKSTISGIKVDARGTMREMDIDKAQWGKEIRCNGEIKAKVRPGKERVFVIGREVLASAKKQTLKMVDPKATAETKALYANLFLMPQRGVMFGHHDFPSYGVGWKNQPGRSDVKDVCGDHPAVYSLDMHNITPAKIENIKEVYRRGGMSMLVWHQDNPLTEGPGKKYPVGTAWDNTSCVDQILVEGSELNLKYKARLDKVAEALHSMVDDNGKPIPVIFRPLHEHTQKWNWWGTKATTDEEFVAFWRFIVSYLRDVKDCHNVIYAISPQMDEPYKDAQGRILMRWPGDDWVDFIGIDCYHFLWRSAFDVNVKALSAVGKQKNKPVGVTEIGLEKDHTADYWTHNCLPYLKGSNLSMMVAWRNERTGHAFGPYPSDASAEDFRSFYADPITVFQKDAPDLYTMPENIIVK